MRKKTFKMVCKLLFAVAIAIDVISAFGIICSVLMITNGRLWAILPLAISIGLSWLGAELGEAAEERIW